METPGKTLISIGLVILVTGGVLWFIGRNGGGFLAGDIVVERKHLRFYFPIVSCIVVSLVLSVIAWLMRR